MKRIIAIAAISILCSAHALTQREVMESAGRVYRDNMHELQRHGRLDPDPRFQSRVERIAAPLIAQAMHDYPETIDYPWELHTTGDGEHNAYVTGGGRMLVASGFADSLDLTDTELAMVLAHEIAHTVLHHDRRELEEALRLDPRWTQRPLDDLQRAVDEDLGVMRMLSPFNARQEVDADAEGLMLAARAGWQPSRLAVFYRKMARASAAPSFGTLAHPAPNDRWYAARALARSLENLQKQ